LFHKCQLLLEYLSVSWFPFGNIWEPYITLLDQDGRDHLPLIPGKFNQLLVRHKRASKVDRQLLTGTQNLPTFFGTGDVSKNFEDVFVISRFFSFVIFIRDLFSMCTNATVEELPASAIFDDIGYENTAVNNFYHISYVFLGTIGLSTTLIFGLISALLLNKYQTGKYFTPRDKPPYGSTWNTRIRYLKKWVVIILRQGAPYNIPSMTLKHWEPSFDCFWKAITRRLLYGWNSYKDKWKEYTFSRQWNESYQMTKWFMCLTDSVLCVLYIFLYCLKFLNFFK